MNELTDIRAIRALLERHGFRFSRSMGQNFLIRSWVPEKIAESAGIDRETGVLEIGPGIGCLTAELSGRAGKVLAVELDQALRPVLTKQLADRAGKVLSVELDRSLEPVLEETLSGCGNVEILFGDVLKQDLRALAAERLGGLRPVVCANLPYNITSPVISALLKAGCFESLTLMVQKEPARRICASAGEADYSAFSIFVQWHAAASLLFDVPADCFLPQPKVTSSVIRLERRAQPPCPVADEALLFRVVRAAFAQRRKTLVNALAASFGELGKQELAECVAACGAEEKVRGEELSIREYCLISDEISRKIR